MIKEGGKKGSAHYWICRVFIPRNHVAVVFCFVKASGQMQSIFQDLWVYDIYWKQPTQMVHPQVTKGRSSKWLWNGVRFPPPSLIPDINSFSHWTVFFLFFRMPELIWYVQGSTEVDGKRLSGEGSWGKKIRTGTARQCMLVDREI